MEVVPSEIGYSTARLEEATETDGKLPEAVGKHFRKIFVRRDPL
jgi:hypothetical protein